MAHVRVRQLYAECTLHFAYGIFASVIYRFLVCPHLTFLDRLHARLEVAHVPYDAIELAAKPYEIESFISAKGELDKARAALVASNEVEERGDDFDVRRLEPQQAWFLQALLDKAGAGAGTDVHDADRCACESNDTLSAFRRMLERSLEPETLTLFELARITRCAITLHEKCGVVASPANADDLDVSRLSIGELRFLNAIIMRGHGQHVSRPGPYQPCDVCAEVRCRPCPACG